MPFILLDVVFAVKLVMVERRHQINSFLYHQLDVAIIEVGAVLKRLDACV